jgi:hypothetical protein
MSLLKVKTSKTKNVDMEEALSAVTEEEVKRVNVNFPKSVYLALKLKATRDEVSISVLFRQWVDEYISAE